MGFLYADGNVYLGNENLHQYSVTLSLKSSDEDHIKKFRDALESDVKISRYTRVFDNGYDQSEMSRF